MNVQHNRVTVCRLPDPDDYKALEFFATNCEKLADILERVPDEKHRQNMWISNGAANHCGSSGCALGWACMSDEFPGLQYTYDPLNPKRFLPVINGLVAEEGWGEAGEKFFGEYVMRTLFDNGSWEKAALIKHLRGFAAAYRDDEANAYAETVDDDEFD